MVDSQTISNCENAAVLPPSDSADTDTLLGVANGIPRSFPFGNAMFLFDRIPWFGKVIEQPPILRHQGFVSSLGPYYYSSCIVLREDWDYPKRARSLLATIEVEPPPPESDNLPDLPAASRAFLEGLGAIQLRSFRAEPDADESRRLAEINASDDLSRFKDELRSLALPFRQEPPGLDQVKALVKLLAKGPAALKIHTESPKKILVAAFKPLGYKYVSSKGGQGGFFLQKRTDANNMIELEFDMGSRYQQCSASFNFHGPLWWRRITICPLSDLITSTAINDTAHWAGMCANMAVIVKHLEGRLVPHAERIFGPAPKWYKYDA
ncbi:MAG: hypothetical protein DCC68_05005 [Planctomycetota bacterium]|nr:MAG: hypothetical protein DCC68_05005 [Planctomycetota bacterium]